VREVRKKFGYTFLEVFVHKVFMQNSSASRPARGHGRSTPGQNVAAPRHTFWWYLKWLFIIGQLVLFCAIITTASVLYGVYQRLDQIDLDVRSITVHSKAEPTVVYAADGTKLAELRGEQRSWIPLAQMQRTVTRNGKTVKDLGWLPKATIAIEDWRFYSHPGMDPKRILKAAWVNFRSGDVEQGGSTITEQLAKNIYLSRTRTLSRRLQTALLALKLERSFSKDEILELYLNEIYYGNNAYGCEAAAQRYFGKPAGELSIAEAALLAGLPNSPTRLDPFDHFDNAKDRQRIVLQSMLQRNKINYTQYLKAVKDKSLEGKIERAEERYRGERRDVQKWRAPYFVSYVKSYLQKQYNWSDEYLSKSGLKIYTTLDPRIESIAEKVMDRSLERHTPGRAPLQGALVCIDPWSGHIIAMYGGRDYYSKKWNGQFNRATQAKRQPGSTFKPYVYATAMEMGYSPDSIVVDKPLTVWGHQIKNYDFKYHGAIPFRKAIGISDNVAATRVLMKIGIQNVIEKAHLMGITSSLRPVPTLALGTSEVSLLETTSAFGVFATRGLRAEPTPIERVDNYAGETLVEHVHPVAAARVLSTDAANSMWDMLHYVMTSGTGRPAQLDSTSQTIGKTGTTSSNKDVWFMGATKQLVAGVWMGYDTPRELYGSSGGGWCGPAWRSFMDQSLDIWKKKDVVERLVEDARATQQRRIQAEQNKQYVRVRICDDTGLLATRSCPHTHVEEFSAAGGAPTQYCDVHRPKNAPHSNDDASQVPATEATPDTGSYDSDPSFDIAPSNEGDNSGSDNAPPARRENGAAVPPGDGREDGGGNGGDSADIVPQAEQTSTDAPRRGSTRDTEPRSVSTDENN
jgi:penicillin-binding protein 1A